MNLSEAITLFLGEYKPTTAASYAYILRDMEAYLGPIRPVDSFEPADLIRYSQHYRKKTNPRTGNRIAPATEKKYATTVKLFWSWCARMQLITHTPAAVIKRPRVERYIGRDKAISDAELETLIEWIKNTRYGISPIRNLAIVLFLADTGCRAGGLCGLQISHLNLASRTGVVTEKGEKTRPIIYGDACANAIAEWLENRPPCNNTYVFVTLTGNKLDRHTLGQIIRRNARAAGLRTISPHAFRHRKGHQFADQKIAPSIAATALGHESSLITIESYYPSDWETTANAMRSLVHHNEDEDEAPPNEKIIKFDSKRTS